MGVAEVDVDSGVDAELDVFTHFGSLIPGERPGEGLGEMLDLSSDSFSYGFRSPVVGKMQQHDEPACAFDQHSDLGSAVSGADDQVAFHSRHHNLQSSSPEEIWSVATI